MHVARTFAFGAICFMIGVGEAAAATIEKTEFADQVQVGDQRLRLNNVGVMRYKVLFKPFVAALYLGDKVEPRNVLEDVPKRLEIEYYYSIDGRDITQAAGKLLTENVPGDRYRALKTKFDQMNSLYKSVKPGDRYTLTYIPGAGAELSLNDKVLGKVEGRDFAAAYFTIWLGNAPMDTALKSDLLRR